MTDAGMVYEGRKPFIHGTICTMDWKMHMSSSELLQASE